MFIFLSSYFLLNSSEAQATAQIPSSHGTLSVDVLRSDLHHPWGMTFLSADELLITERRGRLWRLNLKTGTKKEVNGLPVIQAKGQGGLLDVELSPNFGKDRRVYLSYTGGTPKRKSTHVGYGVLKGTKLKNFRVLFEASPKIASGYHFGSRLVFDSKGFLFITLGDRGSMDMAQDPSNHAGAVVRLEQDGSIPKSNPFIGNSRYQPEIFSFGHRNVQGATLNPWTDDVWTHEHGPRGGDELNLIRPKHNYGWPKVTFGIDYDGSTISTRTTGPGFTAPLHHWTPSIAPSGMTFVYGPEFPLWQGDLLIGSLKFRQLRHLKMKGTKVLSEEILLKEFDERIRDVEIGPAGIVYILTDHKNGKLIRISRARKR